MKNSAVLSMAGCALAACMMAQSPNRTVSGNADAIRAGDCNHLIQYTRNNGKLSTIVSAEFETSGLAAGCSVTIQNVGAATIEIVADDMIYVVSPGTATAPQNAVVKSDGVTLSVSAD